MGFGDPDHHHPLNFGYFGGDGRTCFRCKLPAKLGNWWYGCARCDHFVHQVCFELPHDKRHPLHPQHSLTLLPSSPNLQMDCNRCHQPCLGGYVYHCQACLQFQLHLKCFLTLNLEEKHHHPLTLYELHPGYGEVDCRTCGLLIDGIDRYTFACRGCQPMVFIHFDCAFLPPTVKRHHVHELTFRYNYPEESDLAYCDVCEDKDGKELDRTLSYYYCQRCDYIAHVRCVTTKPAIVTTQLENFVHEHPMIYSRKPPRSEIFECACKNLLFEDSYYFCSQCDYKLHKSCAKFPQFIKHPHHKDHTLSLQSHASLNIEGGLPVCNFCSRKMDDDALILQCMDCDYAEHLSCAVCFRHPYHDHNLLFSAPYDLRFRCNACGELGDGYRMSGNRSEIQYDLHLECYALPGKIERGCHSHPLYLISSPTKIRSDLSTTFRCNVCGTKADSDFWIYCCKQCNYIAHLKCEVSDLPGKIEHGCHSHHLYLISSPTKIRPDLSTTFRCDVCCTKADSDFWIYCCKQCSYLAHLKCVVSDLLSGLGTTNNFSNLCSITECEEEGQFIDHVEPSASTLCSRLETNSALCARPIFHNGPCITPDVTDWNQSSIDVLHCPQCMRPISTQAYSCINDWKYCNFKATIHNQSPIRHEPLALLDEKLIEELYCPICNQLIFPPTYSCAECQIFFHKSCAELPCEYTEDPGHTFVLLSPSMGIDSLSNCVCCRLPIKGYAYVCGSCEIVLDVVCALGAPLLKLENQKHNFISWRKRSRSTSCEACDNLIADDNVFFECRADRCSICLHFECALLPYTVLHRVHQHPLVLETRLDLLVDDYVCDACEKELNPCLWAYRCSDSCGNSATSHVSCIVTSNKKCWFKYHVECHYPSIEELYRHVPLVPDLFAPGVAALVHAPPKKQRELLFDQFVLPIPLVRKMSLQAAATALANALPENQSELLRNNLYVLVDELEHASAYIVTDKLLEMDQAEVLHLIESPDALKEKVIEAMEGYRVKNFAKWLPQNNLN